MMYVGTAPTILRAGLDCIASGAAMSDRLLDDLDVVLWTPTSISHDSAQARDHVRGRVASALRHPLPVELPPEDQAAIRRLRESYDAFQHATADSRHRTLVPDRLVDLMALAGTPEEGSGHRWSASRACEASAGSPSSRRCRGRASSSARRFSGCSPRA